MTMPPLARHLYQDAQPLLRQSSIQRALLVEDAASARPVQQGRPGDRLRSGPGCACDTGQDGGGREHDRGLVHGQINAYEEWPQGYVCFNRRIMYAGLIGARRITASSSTSCASSAAAAYSRCRPTSRSCRIPARQGVHHLLADTPGRCGGPHEAVQARLGHGGLRVRRPPPAVRKVLCRRLVHHPQSFLP